MKNAYHNLIIGSLAFTLLWVTMATDYLNNAMEPEIISSHHAPPRLERVSSAQAGAYHHWSSEDIGRSMVPRARTIQW
ncbi:MAG: hypothetical protein HKP44_12300 [Desulfofustis sp.]|nr:hypothetical protein [Desulfofustis sp.]